MNTHWIAALLFSITPLFAQGEVAPRAGEGATPEWRQRFEEAQQSLQQAREGMQRLMQERAGERRQDPCAGERPMPQRDRAPRQQDERGERQGRGAVIHQKGQVIAMGPHDGGLQGPFTGPRLGQGHCEIARDTRMVVQGQFIAFGGDATEGGLNPRAERRDKISSG